MNIRQGSDIQFRLQRGKSLSAVIDCFQNVFHFECDDTGVGTQDLIMKGLGWFIYFWQVDISRYPKCGEEIIVGTFAYEDRGSSEERNFYIKTVRDDIIVRANSVWSLVDLAKLQIMRIPNEVMVAIAKGMKISWIWNTLAGGFDIAENATSEKSENILSAD